MAQIDGRALVLGNHINTDQIISTKYMLLSSITEMSKYAFSSIREDFSESVRPGDIIIAGSNFGCGSAREQAPQVIKAIGIAAVIAHSFHNTFFRNAINVGLACFTCHSITEQINERDLLSLDMDQSTLYNKTQTIKISLPALSQIAREILDAGGLVEYYLNHFKGEHAWESEQSKKK